MNSTDTNKVHIYFLFISFFILLVPFFLHLYIAYNFYFAGFFTFDDGFFDSDIWTNHTALAHGWSRRNFAHPHLSNFFSIPIRVIDYVFYKLNFISNRESFREILALTISPLFVLMSSFLFIKISLLNKVDKSTTLILAALYSFSFTNFYFGSVPESFAISSFGITSIIYYYSLLSQKMTKDSFFIWFVLGFFLVSITITSIVILYIVYYFHLVFNNKLNYKISIFQSLIFVSAVFVFSVVTFLFSNYFLGYQQEASNSMTHYLSFVSIEIDIIIYNLLNILGAFFNSYVAIGLASEPLNYCGELVSCKKITFLNSNKYWFSEAIIISLLIYSLYILKIKNIMKKNKIFLLMCFFIIVFNIAFHMFFGTEMFLFSAHWITALTFILFPIVKQHPRIFSAFICFMILFNVKAMIYELYILQS